MDFRKRFFQTIFFTAALFLVLGFFNFAFAEDNLEEPNNDTVIHIFYSNTCGNCAKAKVFLGNLKKEYPEVEIHQYVISKKENIEKWKRFYENYEVPQQYYGRVPAIFIGEKYFIGYDERAGEAIKEYVVNLINNQESREEIIEPEISLPIVGKIKPGEYSLPILAVLLGGLDGFNVCSLGALVLILGLVLSLRDRKKILALGGVFILITGLVYGFLITLWYQLFSLLVAYARLMEVFVGVIAILGAIYFIKEFYRMQKYGATCDSAGNKIVSKFSSKLQKCFSEKRNIWLLLLLVLLFSAVVTIVEFPCSAAVPLVFAGILSKAQLSGLYYLLYLSLFVLFYLLDEIIIFLVAVFTLNLRLTSPNFTKTIVAIEAVILTLLGFYYLLAPYIM